MRDLDHDIDAEKLYFSNYGSMLFPPILILNFAVGKLLNARLHENWTRMNAMCELAVKLMQSTENSNGGAQLLIR